MAIIHKLVRNIRTTLRHPEYLSLYLTYQLQRLSGEPVLEMSWGDKVGGFVNFSEYLSSPSCLGASEMRILGHLAAQLHECDEGRPGQAPVIDVGANLGLTGLFLSRLFPDRAVVCFEPAPTTYAALVANVARNARLNMACEQWAVSDVVGTVLFDISTASRANARLVRGGGDSLSVAATTLDEYCGSHDIAHIALLKVDTEGFEHRVFEGAKSLLERTAIDAIYFEFCPALEKSAGVEVGSAVRVLERHGYLSYSIFDGRLKPFSVSTLPLPSLCNLVAFPTSRGRCFAELIQAG